MHVHIECDSLNSIAPKCCFVVLIATTIINCTPYYAALGIMKISLF